MIIIEAILEAAAGARDQFVTLLRRTMTASQREKGCVAYRFTADLDLPDRFILNEIWENEADLKAHFAGEAFRNFFAELPGKGSSVSFKAWQGSLVSYVPPNRA